MSAEPSRAEAVVAKDAATIMLVRDREAVSGKGETLEVCMLKRHIDSDFVGGAYVFPGGKLDEADRGPEAADLCAGRHDEQASSQLGIASGGLAFWVAALRECFEEAGVLLAYESGPKGGAPVRARDPEVRNRLRNLRTALNKGEIGFVEGLRSEGLSLAADRLHYFSHWITPEGAPKRYDTRFFVAALPAGQLPVHDDYETVDTVWVAPGEALRSAADGEFELIFPTMKNLQAISRFADSRQLLHAAATAASVPTILPRVVADDRGFRIVLPGDPGYEEAVAAAESTERSHGDAEQEAGASGLSMKEVSALVRSVGIDGVSRPAEDPPAPD